MNKEWDNLMRDFNQWEKEVGDKTKELRATIKAGEAYYCPQCGKHLHMDSKPLRDGGRGYRFACTAATHFHTHRYRTPAGALRELLRRFEGDEKR